MLRFLAIAALATALLPAQRPTARKKPAPKPAAPAPTAWALEAIHISGNKVFPSDAIVRATGLRIGTTVKVDDLQRAIERLTAAGAFETLSYRYTTAGEKLTVTFEVQEVIDLYPVGFERLDVPDAELFQALSERVPLFGRQIPATGAMVQRIVEALQVYLAAKGNPPRLTGRLLSKPGGLVMTFRPAEAPPVITFVKFEGTAVLRAEDLQKTFYQVAVGVPYTEERLRELLDHNIRPLFEEKGRLRVHFGSIRTEESKDPTGLLITVPVEDGEEFRFGSVRFAGSSLLSEKELSRLARVEEGEVANFALVNRALSAIEDRYKRDGFLAARAALERILVDKTKTVDLVIHVREGNRYNFRRLEIKGLDINSAAAVRKRWALQRGQPFDASYPEIFLKRIEEEAMFDRLAKTRFHVVTDEEAKMVDVELEFIAEAPKPKVAR